MFEEPNRNVNYFYETTNMQLEKIKTTINNNNYMLSKYKAALTEAGVLANNARVENKDLTACEDETLHDYETLKTSQDNLKAQLKDYESILEKMPHHLPAKNGNSQPVTTAFPGTALPKK